MRVFAWHVHGSWMTSFLQGGHTVLLPRLPDRGPDGRGLADTWEWPSNAVEISPEEARDVEVDAVILQRPQELEVLAAEWLGGRQPGRDLPAVYLEHNAPQGHINDMRHPAADRPDLLLVHVTHFNALLWDSGTTPVRVVEHGIIDPGERYTGTLARAAVVINEPQRRNRVTGTDLLGLFSRTMPVDVFGMQSEGIGTSEAQVSGANGSSRASRPEHSQAGYSGARSGGAEVKGHGNLAQEQLHVEMAQRRVYLHPVRWTSLGLSLLEAMHLGMPIVALATTEVPLAVPPQAGVVSNQREELVSALRAFGEDLELAQSVGKAARSAALRRYGLGRFLNDWDRVLYDVVQGD